MTEGSNGNRHPKVRFRIGYRQRRRMAAAFLDGLKQLGWTMEGALSAVVCRRGLLSAVPPLLA